MSFTDDTASKTDKSVRTTQRQAKIGAALKDMAEEVAATPIADNQKEMLALAKLTEEEQRQDECKDWADKSAALASYAKQAEDDELEKFALRVRARAIRRCGELLQAIEKKPGQRTDRQPSMDTHTRFQAAENVGLSKHKRDTALRLATIPEEDFDAAVTSDDPPTITALAEQGLSLHPFVACNFGVSQNAA